MAREAALAAAASAASRLTALRVAKAVRETEDRAFSAHALALEDAATAQQQRHRQALADAIAACEARHAEALDQRRRSDQCGNQPVRQAGLEVLSIILAASMQHENAWRPRTRRLRLIHPNV